MSETLEKPIEPPEGMMLNAVGGYTPTKHVKPQTLMEDQVVEELVQHAQEVHRRLAQFRDAAFEEVDTFLGLLAEKYDAPRGGERGNVTLQTFDGLRKVSVATGDFLTFGPELQIAKSLVDECLTRWTDGAGSEIQAIVQDAFDVGKEGKIRVDRILALRRLDIEDPTWAKAMGAISDAVRVTHSKRYIRFYERATHDGDWHLVSLDFSRVAS